jgi:hypothetical protein
MTLVTLVLIWTKYRFAAKQFNLIQRIPHVSALSEADDKVVNYCSFFSHAVKRAGPRTIW